ncbi:MAG: hypothetical protein CO125_09470 [Hydrogenophilales bacterium CG_4_9_14_3_um_filter_59_35]|nr:MAG: hypothetical protein COZ23_01705 [Hydrogenophilales bacterium CG_4_10_14_3_um_filter_58_23]PJB05237.1 MAG: hypothetical protein CO125_09470 [Hydrogenophilales bacterium CG_4_9_14_3_um_filter_59_35]
MISDCIFIELQRPLEPRKVVRRVKIGPTSGKGSRIGFSGQVLHKIEHLCFTAFVQLVKAFKNAGFYGGIHGVLPQINIDTTFCAIRVCNSNSRKA